MKNHSLNSDDKALLPVKALPIDDHFSDQDYELPEEDRMAMEYLRGVRAEAAQIPQICRGGLKGQSGMSQNGVQRDYVEVSLSRLIFKPSEIGNSQEDEEMSSDDNQLYKDQDIVVSKTQVSFAAHPLWKPEWIKEVLSERLKLRSLILSQQKTLKKSRDAYEYYEGCLALLKNDQLQLTDIGLAGELVLQEIFGIIATEKENEWDKAHSIKSTEMEWIYGLLCLLEKPLLPDQAADLNQLMNIMLKQRTQLTDIGQIALLDVNIAIITEYFEQRFK